MHLFSIGSLYLHNSLTGQKELFKPIDENCVTFYVCGPTVYNYIHIGNARPSVIFDVLYRLLQKLYPCVRYARNITDIDDKIMAKAKEENLSVGDISQRYMYAYFEDTQSLGNLEPTVTPKATEHIPEMIALIEKLIQRGHAYVAEGHALFHVLSMNDYGALSKKPQEDLIAGARVEVAPYKKNAADFVLWKPSTPDQPSWDSPWGKGRPGWHIECSAMIHKHLGINIDIHGGGQDLIFPHHENEMAQGKCAHPGSCYAKYWVHNGYITVDEEKMSKSLGNFITVRALLEKYSGEVLRYALLSTHYRSPLNWSEDFVDQCRQSLTRLYLAIRDFPVSLLDTLPVDTQSEAPFWAALLDDLNTPLALSILHAWVSELNKSSDLNEKHLLAKRIRSASAILGLLQKDADTYFQVRDDLSQKVSELIEKRRIARAAKNFIEADVVRKELLELGVELEDTLLGQNGVQSS
jgi:cysteinyl-tRNA synthetase